MPHKFSTPTLVATLVLALTLTSLAACGSIPVPSAAAQTPRAYTAQDALAAWHAHGLQATLGDTGGPPPTGFTAAYLVSPPLFTGVRFMMLYVAPTPAVAEASLDRFGHGPALGRRWRQANLILLSGDDSAQPYVIALGDLR